MLNNSTTPEQVVDKMFDDLVKSRFIEMFGTSINPKYGSVKIEELVSKDIEKVAKRYDLEDEINYIDISSINKESRTIVGTTVYLVKDAPSRAQQCVCKGDILLSNVRPNLKTLAIVTSNEDKLVCSTGFTVLRCTKSCPEYLIIAITEDHFTNKLVKKVTGSNYPAVTSKDVLKSTIPNAPFELQKQFAVFVQQVDKSKVIYKEVVSKFDDLIKSRFIEMFDKYKTNMRALDVVCDSITAGGDKPNLVSSVKTKECPHPIYSNGETNMGLFGYTDGYIIGKPAVTISARGTIGFVAVRDAFFTPIVRLITLIPSTNLNCIYLKYALEGSISGNAGSSIQQLTVPNVKNIKIPLPPFDEQTAFETFVKQIDKMKTVLLSYVISNVNKGSMNS